MTCTDPKGNYKNISNFDHLVQHPPKFTSWNSVQSSKNALKEDKKWLYLLILFRSRILKKTGYSECFRTKRRFISLLSLTQAGQLNYETLSNGIYLMLLLEVKSIVRENRWTARTMIEFSYFLLEWREALFEMMGMVDIFDEYVKNLVSHWGKSFLPRLLQRPCHQRQLMHFKELMPVMNEWSHMTYLISGSIPTSDHICREYWLCLSNSFSTQTTNNWIDCLSNFISSKFLHGDDKKYLGYCLQEIDRLLLRTVLRSYCKNVVISQAAPCSLFQARDSEQMKNLLAYLEDKAAFVCTHADKNTIEFCTKNLLDPHKVKRFKHFTCDRPEEFADDYCITCYTDLYISKSVRGERVLLLDLPMNSVVLSCRNPLAKKKLKTELKEQLGLELAEDLVSPVLLSEKYALNGQEIVYATQSFVHIWTFEYFDKEGILDQCPKVCLYLAFFFLEILFDFLLTPKRSSRYITRFLWYGAFRIIKVCLWYLSKYHREGRITKFYIRILPTLQHLKRAIIGCPFSDAYDREKLDKLLEDLAQSMKRSIKNSSCRHYTKIQCGLLFSEGCRRLLYPERIWPPRPTDGFFIVGLVGAGTYGSVYKVYDYKHDAVLAMKEIDLPNDHTVLGDVLKEVNYLRCLRHQNVVTFYEAFVKGNKLYIKMEFCAGKSLLALIQSGVLKNISGKILDMNFKRIIVHTLLGLSFLHANNIVHGDLKPANLLHNIFDWTKLADFGATRTLFQSVDEGQVHWTLGTTEYMAPETLLHGIATTKSDIWSIGCTFYHLVTGQAPWVDVVKPWGIIMFLQQGKLFDMKPLENCPLDHAGKAMIMSCLQFDPEKRPEAFELLLTPFIYDPLAYDPSPVQKEW